MQAQSCPPFPLGASRRAGRRGLSAYPRRRRGGPRPAGTDDAPEPKAVAAQPAEAVQVAALVRVFLVAGWSVSDLVYALDHAPDGAAHWHTAPVHSPAGWLRL